LEILENSSELLLCFEKKNVKILISKNWRKEGKKKGLSGGDERTKFECEK
jgi:hypothetical protein